MKIAEKDDDQVPGYQGNQVPKCLGLQSRNYTFICRCRPSKLPIYTLIYPAAEGFKGAEGVLWTPKAPKNLFCFFQDILFSEGLI